MGYLLIFEVLILTVITIAGIRAYKRYLADWEEMKTQSIRNPYKGPSIDDE